MNSSETSGQETSGTDRQPTHRSELAAAADEKTLKRARWEHLRMAACSGAGRVNVTNYSYGVEAAQSGEHTYTVAVERGEAVDCTCPAAEYQPGPCKHAVAVADAPGVLDEAMHGGSEPSTAAGSTEQVATDGGEPVDVDDYVDLSEVHDRVTDRPESCQCDEQLGEGMVCSPCLRRNFGTPVVGDR